MTTTTPSLSANDIASIEDKALEETQNIIDYHVLRDLYSLANPDSFLFEINPYTHKPKLLTILESYIERTDYQLLEVESSELLSIICYNSDLVSQIMFTFGLSHE